MGGASHLYYDADSATAEQLIGQADVRAGAGGHAFSRRPRPRDTGRLFAGRAGQGCAAKKMIIVLRHPSFERGPPTHYYMDLLVLIFNVLMGIGVFTRV